MWNLKKGYRDFPGGPVVGTSPSGAWSTGLIPGWGARIPPASWPKKIQDVKQKQCCNKFNKDYENGPNQKNLKKIKYNNFFKGYK